MTAKGLETEIYNLALETGRQRFFPTSGSAYSILSDFGIHISGMSKHRPPFDICRLTFDQHSAYFCVSGRGSYVTPKGSGVLHPGEVWIVPAFYPHRYWVESEWTYVWVHFRDDGHWRLWSEMGEMKKTSPRIDLIHRVAEGMLEHGERWEDTEALEQWTRLFVLYLRHELMAPDDHVRRWQAALSAVWREVRVNPAKPWRLDELADFAHMSLTHFNRAMHRIYAAPAGTVLTRIRLEKALTLMRGTNMTLDSIATQTGYSTGFALSKAFQRVYGDSPRRVANRPASLRQE